MNRTKMAQILAGAKPPRTVSKPVFDQWERTVLGVAMGYYQETAANHGIQRAKDVQADFLRQCGLMLCWEMPQPTDDEETGRLRALSSASAGRAIHGLGTNGEH
jgi:hypothetical protein